MSQEETLNSPSSVTKTDLQINFAVKHSCPLKHDLVIDNIEYLATTDCPKQYTIFSGVWKYTVYVLKLDNIERA